LWQKVPTSIYNSTVRFCVPPPCSFEIMADPVCKTLPAGVSS
jgi:hypothetical protein